jgi:hypothetical protein
MALFVALSCWHFGQAHVDTQHFPAPRGTRLRGCTAAGLTALGAEWLLGNRHPGVRRRTTAALVDLAAIACLAVAADPLFSVGTYFLVWRAPV